MKKPASFPSSRLLLDDCLGFKGWLVLPMTKRLSLEGDMMDPKGKDQFIEEVDQELRSIDARLKKVLSDADQLLQEHSKDTEQAEESTEEETKEA